MIDAIRFLDVRNGGPVAHAQARVQAATALRKACLGAAAPVGRLCLPSIDRIAANWLCMAERSMFCSVMRRPMNI